MRHRFVINAEISHFALEFRIVIIVDSIERMPHVTVQAVCGGHQVLKLEFTGISSGKVGFGLLYSVFIKNKFAAVFVGNGYVLPLVYSQGFFSIDGRFMAITGISVSCSAA